MNIDHIFIFTDDKDQIANKLLAFGLTEGASRIHKGQGTANRTFVFNNFYLEMLWVHNEQEIKSANVLPTSLWARANFKVNHSAPFGLCIDNTDETKELFVNAFPYQPDYFPKGMTIDMLNNKDNFCLPLTFKLPFKRDRQEQSNFLSAKNGIKALTKAQFQYTKADNMSFLDYFKSEEQIEFTQFDTIWLTLTFDNNWQGLKKTFEEVKLTINY